VANHVNMLAAIAYAQRLIAPDGAARH
jgi:hypothetical protein